MKEKQTASASIDNLTLGDESLSNEKEQVKSGIANKVAMILLATTIMFSSCGERGGSRKQDKAVDGNEITMDGLTKDQIAEVVRLVKHEFEKNDYYNWVSEEAREKLYKDIESGTIDFNGCFNVDQGMKEAIGTAQSNHEKMLAEDMIEASSYYNLNGLETEKVFAEYKRLVASGELQGSAEMLTAKFGEMIIEAGIDPMGEK